MLLAVTIWKKKLDQYTAAYSVAFHTTNVSHICLVVCPSYSFEGVVGGAALNLYNAVHADSTMLKEY